MMRKGMKEVRRKLGRAIVELRAAALVARAGSVADGLATLRAKARIQLMNRNGGVETPAATACLMRKHSVMRRFLDGEFASWWASYTPPVIDAPVPEERRGRIWVCWWQGLDAAPPVVRACVESIRRNADGHEVVVITDSNVADYVEFPPHILDKVARGVISRTIQSDLLRLSLLSRYGGVWLDSTFFAAAPLGGCFAAPLWTIKRPDYNHVSVACGYFANYSLGCDETHRWVFRTVLDFLFHYWERYDLLIDYLLTDYAVDAAARHIPAFAEALAAVEPNNPDCDELWKLMSRPFDPQLWQRLKARTALFKLSWKTPCATLSQGRPTFYAALLDGSLR